MSLCIDCRYVTGGLRTIHLERGQHSENGDGGVASSPNTGICASFRDLPMFAVMNAGCILYTGEGLPNSKKNVAKVTKIAGSI